MPLNGTPSTHIVKPGPEDFPHSVENEYFCQRLAAELGLRASVAAKRIAAQAEKDWPSPIYERIVDTIALQVAHVMP